MLRKARYFSVALAGMATFAALPACSKGAGSSGSNSAAPPAAGAAAGAAAGVTAAHAQIAEFTKLPTYVAPGATIDGKGIGSGKTLLVIPYSTQIPYNNAFSDAITKAASAVGMKTKVYADNGAPDEWARGIEYGINQHVDAIALIAGLNVDQVIPQIQEATKAGIPVIGSTFEGYDAPSPTYLSADVPLDYARAGGLEANYAISAKAGKVNALIVTSSGLQASKSMTPAVQATFAKNCPGCKVKTIDIPVTQWSTGIQPQVEAAITADPSIDYILPNYDSEASYVIAALRAKGKTDVGVATFNGTPAPMALLQSGQISMDTGENINWAGNATVDAALRTILNKGKSIGRLDEHIPLRVFDKSNAKDVGVPPNLTSGYGNAADQYLKTWGVS